MITRLIGIFIACTLLNFQLFVGSAYSLEFDEATLTVNLNDKGDTYVLTLKEVKQGKKLFNNVCAQCHAGGVTKTNQNVGLAPETLEFATPYRNSIEGLVDYMINPTTYDGEVEISEFHPSMKSADIFPEMRNLSEEDLEAIAGHILLQPKIRGVKWGGGKIYY